MRIEEIISRFQGVRSLNDRSYQCRCPCHNDREASLTVTQAGDKLLLHCHAGCDTRDILQNIGLTMADINGEKQESSWKEKLEGFMHKKIEAVYEYTNEKGVYLYSKIRFEGKVIRYGVLDKKEDFFHMNVKGIEKTLYQLPKLLSSIKNGYPVYFVEGEKDVHTLQAIGLTATTCGGVSDWKKEFAPYFKGAKVIVLPDYDEPGERLCQQVLRDIKQYAYYTKTVTTSRTEKGDVTDYIQKEGHTKEELQALVQGSRYEYAPWVYQERADSKPKVNTDILADTICKTLDYLILRKKGNPNDLFYIYKDGVYSLCGKAEVKGQIKQYLPVGVANDNMLNNTYNLLLCSSGHVYDFEVMDTKEHLINVKNGIYNVKTRQLEPHSPQLFSALQIDCRYNENAPKPQTWLKFIDDLCTDEEGDVDQERVCILQEWAGLMISNVAVHRTKKSLILYSSLGNTGKSVYMKTVSGLIGMDNTINIPIQNLSDRFSIGDVYGKRGVVVGDQKVLDIEDSSAYKQLTGGDLVRAEMKGKQSFNFIFKGGLMFACNGLPYFRDDKGGHIFERMLLLNCTNVIPEEKRDAKLYDKISQEREGILLWALEGLHRLLEHQLRFTSSKAGAEALKEYRKNVDTLYRFIDENCIVTGDKTDKIKRSEFHEDYKKWCSKNEYTSLSNKNLPERMRKNGIEAIKMQGIYFYRSIKYQDFSEPDLKNYEQQ